MINERIQARWCMNVQFRDSAAEEVGQRPSGLVLRIEIQQLHGNLIRVEPFR